ncbi:hypothetical protein Hanom_Chr00s000006g01614391 [Helianthus anomalus]
MLIFNKGGYKFYSVWTWRTICFMCAEIKIVIKRLYIPVARNYEDFDEVRFLVDLNKLIRKMFAFKIEITNDNLTNFDEVYAVTSMTSGE